MVLRPHSLNKRQTNQPRKSSTNTRALSTRITNLQNEVNPIPRARSASSTPRPMRTSTQVYVTRKVRVVKSIPSTSATVEVTLGDVYTGLGNNSSVVRVNGASVWNTTNSSASTNYVSVTFPATVTTTSSAYGPFEDWGAGGQSASVSVDLPNTLAETLTTSSGGTGAVATVAVVPSPSVTYTTPQVVVVDLYLAVRM